MATVSILRLASRGHPYSLGEADSAILASFERATSGAASAWADANTTTIQIGGGASNTQITMGASGVTTDFPSGSTVDFTGATITGLDLASHSVDDANNASAVTVVTLEHTTTGIAAAGMGVNLDLNLEDDAGNSDVSGRIASVWTDPTSTSEDAYLGLHTIVAGALTEIVRVAGDGLRWPSDNTKDIGASGTDRPRTGYFGTSVVTPLIDNPSATLTVGASGTTVDFPSGAAVDFTGATVTGLVVNHIVDDANNASSVTASQLDHTLSSGTAAAGMGVSLDFRLEDSAANTDVAARVDAVWADATSGAEDANLVFSSMLNGVLTTGFEWLPQSGALRVGGSTASRTVIRGETGDAGAARYQSVHVNTTSTNRQWLAMLLDHDTTGINPIAGLGSYIRYRGRDTSDGIQNMMDLRAVTSLTASTNYTAQFQLHLARGGSLEQIFSIEPNGTAATLNEAFWTTHHRFTSDNLYDIGADTDERPRNIYLAGRIVGGNQGVNDFTITTEALANSTTPDLNLITAQTGTPGTTGSIYVEPGGTNAVGGSSSYIGGTVFVLGGSGSNTNGGVRIRSGNGIGTAGDVRLGVGSTNIVRVDGGGLIAHTDDTYDIGNSGDNRFRFLYLSDGIVGGDEGANFSISAPGATTGATDGTNISITCGGGNTTGAGGDISIITGVGGNAVASVSPAGNGGTLALTAAAGGDGAAGAQAAGNGGDATLDAGPAGATNGGTAGTAGSVTIGGTNALAVNVGRSGGQLGFFGTSAVSQPSAYTPTNVSTDRSYDANSTTLDEVADVLGTLIADLQSLGLIG